MLGPLWVLAMPAMAPIWLLPLVMAEVGAWVWRGFVRSWLMTFIAALGEPCVAPG